MAKPPIKAIFESLRGSWTLQRTLTSKLASFPSGTFTGTATFTPHHSFDSSSLLYHESGELKTSNGLVLRANKKYLYSYQPEQDKITAWFVKESRDGDNATPNTDEADYVFHELVFEDDDNSAAAVGSAVRLKANGNHLCIKDFYSAFYEFSMQNEVLERWSLTYEVKGPSKDYTSSTTFTR